MLLPSIRMGGNLRFAEPSTSGSATKPLLVPCEGFELPVCVLMVGVVGLLFDQANTESTASFPRTNPSTTLFGKDLSNSFHD
jgi:hypothetical protein